MISIIISTYRQDYLDKLIQNISETVGVEYELITISNTGAKKGLCEVYNIGANKAKHPILCFMHEDINIKTHNWGNVISQLFQYNSDLGLIGVAGSSYKACVPTGWSYKRAPLSSIYDNHIQSNGGIGVESYHVNVNPNKECISKVATIDGLWFCTKKEIALEYPFDEKTFKGFHCYDADFSLSVSQKYDVAVTFEVLIEHFSHGGFNKEWMVETLKLHKKWRSFLPINHAGYSKEEQIFEEEKAFYDLLENMLKFKYTRYDIFKVLWSKKIRSYFNFKTFVKLNLAVNKA